MFQWEGLLGGGTVMELEHPLTMALPQQPVCHEIFRLTELIVNK